jgi:hypothetical protein
MEGNMAKTRGTKTFEDAVAEHQVLNMRTRRKQWLRMVAAELGEMIDRGELSDQAYQMIAQVVQLVRGKSIEPAHGIDLRHLQVFIDAKENLKYLRKRELMYRLLAQKEMGVSDFLRWGWLPQKYEHFRGYLRVWGVKPLFRVLIMTRDEHYGFAHTHHLHIDEQFLDDLDAMFQEVLGIGLETPPHRIIDECDIQVGHLKAAIRMTKQFSA